MSVLTVGAGQTYATLSAAVAASSSFDTINVLAGTYFDDFTTIGHTLSINGVGGLAHFVATIAPPNGKAIMTVGADLSLNGLEFSGAAVDAGSGNNAAGIRYEAGDLSIINSWFHNNQNGILATPSTLGTGTISIDHSEFNNNGAGDGLSHNLYVGEVAALSVTNSYFHDANGGHELKTRADSSVITGNLIAEAPGTVTLGYAIDLPVGGQGTISGNVIEKGAGAQNSIYVAVGEEPPSHNGSTLSISCNAMINNMAPGQTAYAVFNPNNLPVTLDSNAYYGFNAGLYTYGAATDTGTSSFLALPADPLHTSSPCAVPEPNMLPLLLLAAAGIAWWRRGRTRVRRARVA